MVFDVIVIGGGFYGCTLALFLKKHDNRVLLLEKEDDILTRASYNNQARVHNGYHYPRSFITALRSHANYQRFIKDFKDTVDRQVFMVYAIASQSSKTTSLQFIKFCKQVGLPLKPVPQKIKKLFNEHIVEDVFQVEEVVFDAGQLRKNLRGKLRAKEIKVLLNSEVLKVSRDKGGIVVELADGRTFATRQLFNCTYFSINRILKNSKLPLLQFKYELTEMPLVVLPQEFSKLGVTVMDGPFFGFLPFPDRRLHALYHVRYTPRKVWLEHLPKKVIPNGVAERSQFLFMIKDAARFIPVLREAKYVESLYEIRTILPTYEITDGRPILFRPNYGIPGFHIVMGGKIDNVYDVLEEIKNLF